MHKTITRVAILGAGVLLASGCASGVLNSAGDTTQAPETTLAPVTAQAPATTVEATTTAAEAGGLIAGLPQGWKVLTGNGVSIGAPQRWLDIKPLIADPTARAQFEQSIKDQSSSDFLDAMTPQLVDQINILAMDGASAASGNPMSLTVIVDESGLVQDLDTLGALLPSQLSLVGGTLANTSRAQVGGHDTLVVDYGLTAANGIEATGRQYHQLVGSSLVSATFTSSPDEIDLALWDQMAGTLALG